VTPFLFGLLAALGNMVGAWVVVRHARRGLHVVEQFVAFGAGFMISAVVLAMLPEALERPGAPTYVLAGFLAVHLAQHVLTPHFHFGEETHRISASAGVSALIGLSLHTLFDGVAIASGFLVSPELGVLLFLAVFLHKLPEGVTMASVMLAGGQGASRALGAAGVLGVATIAGVGLTHLIAPLATHGLSLSAGVTLYVAASNLVPEFQARRGWAISAAFFGGAAAMIVTRLLLHGLGLTS
jgi:ZIP family zinc transporter/zinc and cadmium transporter